MCHSQIISSYNNNIIYFCCRHNQRKFVQAGRWTIGLAFSRILDRTGSVGALADGPVEGGFGVGSACPSVSVKHMDTERFKN